MRVRGATLRSLLLVGLAVACASGGGGGPPPSSFLRHLGTATKADAMTRLPRLLRLYNYELLREDSVPTIMIETHWKPRVPFLDESQLGIGSAENRVMVTGRARQSTELGSLYMMDMTIENRVRLGDAAEWIETSASPMYRAYADSLTKHMQRELTIGVRRY